MFLQKVYTVTSPSIVKQLDRKSVAVKYIALLNSNAPVNHNNSKGYRNKKPIDDSKYSFRFE